MTALDQANRFLALLDSDSAPHEWHYRAICPKERTDLADAGKAKNVRSLQALEAKNIGGWGAYVVVNAGGHDTRNITRVRALYVDFDQVDDHLDRLRDLVPFEPSIVVESSPGKHHVYWIVDGVPVDEFEQAQKRLIELLGSDASVSDLPRVMRLPGFIHTKDKESPFLSRITHESGTRYDWFEFSEWLSTLEPAGKRKADKPDATAVNVDQLHLELIGELLEYIENTDSTDYGFWQTIISAVHHETNGSADGYQLAVAWSAKSAKHDESDMPKKWASFGTHPEPATIGTLKMRAKAGGWSEFVSLMRKVETLDADSPVELIEHIVRNAFDMSPVERDRVLKATKKRTGINLGTFREMHQESAGSDEGGPDHLAIARQAIAEIGADNVLSSQSFVWAWSDAGVWRKQDDRSVRQWVQSRIESCGEAVTKGLVDSVSDLFKTEVYKADHLFDVGPAECVNVTNGELVLEAGQWTLHPHEREHYRTTQLPVAYDPAATAPRFVQFLDEVFSGDHDSRDKQRALLEMIGYTLIAHCRYERFVILVGTGANGKSVLLSVLEALCGPENVAGVQPSQFDRSFQRAHLHGKLANIVTEVKQGEVIDDASLKGIVSGEPTTVEHKFRDPFVMRPFSTCWFGTNHMPHTRDFSDALFRRALVVEFNNKFKPELGNCDPKLKDKLVDELPGILNMAMTAYAHAVEHGFTLPASCEAARNAWRLEADQVAQFVEEECTVDPLGFTRVEPQKLFNSYRDWARDSGISKTVGMRAFRDRLTVLGYQGTKSNGVRYIVGLSCNRQEWATVN